MMNTSRQKSYGDKVNTNFQGKKMKNEGAPKKWLSLIKSKSVFKINKKFYPQTLLKDWKCDIKKNKMENLIYEDLDLSSSYESANESDNEYDN